VLSLFLDPGTRDFNFDQLRGPDVPAETLASMLGTPPMMAEHRVVLVRDVQGLTPKARESLELALAKPNPGLVLVLMGTIPSGSKSRFYDGLVANALAVEFPAVDSNDLPGWLVERARSEHGVEIEMDAARALSAAIGPTLGVLATELEKAVAYAGDRKVLTLADIKAVGGYIPNVDRWGWFDRIGKKDFTRALEEVPELLESDGAVWLIMGLTSHMLKLGLAVAGGQEGLDRALRPNQRWLANRLLPQARQWTAAQIDAALADLLRTDSLLKSASLTDRQAIEELLIRMMEASGTTSRGRSQRTARSR
jgi:DNA polymerase-3 subunit delta